MMNWPDGMVLEQIQHIYCPGGGQSLIAFVSSKGEYYKAHTVYYFAKKELKKMEVAS